MVKDSMMLTQHISSSSLLLHIHGVDVGCVVILFGALMASRNFSSAAARDLQQPVPAEDLFRCCFCLSNTEHFVEEARGFVVLSEDDRDGLRVQRCGRFAEGAETVKRAISVMMLSLGEMAVSPATGPFLERPREMASKHKVLTLRRCASAGRVCAVFAKERAAIE